MVDLALENPEGFGYAIALGELAWAMVRGNPSMMKPFAASGCFTRSFTSSITSAPITGGEDVTIRFAIWDTGDHNLDSSVLVDAFEWIANGGTVKVGTVKPPA